MIEVKVKIPGNEVEFEKSAKKFKKIINNSGILQEARERRYFIKKSEKKRLERNSRKRRK